MVKPSTHGAFVKGLDASAGIYTQPKGTLPRLSNLLLTERGSLVSSDGTQSLHAFNGIPTAGRGAILSNFLFQPTGVVSYYLAIARALNMHLGAPRNLTLADAGTGGTLAAATYFYVVTAIDGAGGETVASVEPAGLAVAANHKITLTWNVVPNAYAYNIYRSTLSGSELLLAGTGLPVLQPSPLTLTVTFTDTGFSTASQNFTLTEILTGTDHHICTAVLPTTPPTSIAGLPFSVTGNSLSGLNSSGTVSSVGAFAVVLNYFTNIPTNTIGTGGTLHAGGTAPPLADTTQQTALFKMPQILGIGANLPVSYTDLNIAALFPAIPLSFGLGGGGGAGGSGAIGTGTVNGGIAGLLDFIPEVVQFTNQAVLALGNGFAPQVYSDPNTSVNPSTTVAISAISVDANGVVTITTTSGHNINTTQGIGANITIAGVTNAAYNSTTTNPAFLVIAIPSSTQLKVVNTSVIGQGASSGGTITVTTIPVISTFVPAFPVWTTAVAYAVNSIIQPTPNTNNIYFKAIQGGTSGASQPAAFGTQTAANKGAQVADGNIIWVNQGSTNTAAPAPPGAAHITVYAGSLWFLNTSPSNTATGLDGPTSLRMSDVNNLNSYNPINQAFLDKDDGTEGMGLTPFTITAQGIPPVGSLTAFKLYATYQIVGVFGSTNFSIQRALTDMGATVPRSIQFLPGYGLARMTHLGIAVFDGVNDRIISEPIRPFLFPLNDYNYNDITVADASWLPAAWGAQTASPPMYVFSIPIGTSGGQLTRILCFDLVFKAWTTIDLPFPITCLIQARTGAANPVTVMASAGDGTIQRWQAGDATWATSALASGVVGPVAWSLRTPTTASKDPDTRLYCRRVVVKGTTGVSPSFNVTISISPRVGGVQRAAQSPKLGQSGTVQGIDFAVQAAVGEIANRFDAVISGQGVVTLYLFDFHVVPRPLGVLSGVVS